MDLTTGIRVTVTQPTPPIVTVPPPSSPRVTVLPVRGPQGPAGNAGSAWSHQQTTPAATWILTHNLSIYPVPVILLDDAPDRSVYTDVDYVDANSFTLTFPSPVTGWVHIH